LAEILQWIEAGPILQQPASHNATEAPITTPVYVPATLQYVPFRATPSSQSIQVEEHMVSDLDESEKQRVFVLKKVERKENSEKQRVSVLHEIKQKASTTLIGPNKTKRLLAAQHVSIFLQGNKGCRNAFG
jgi:hypothetical protein